MADLKSTRERAQRVQRFSLATLRRREPPERVRVVGRVLESTEEKGIARFRLMDHSAKIWITGPGAPPRPGDWISAEGQWNGERVKRALFEVVNTPTVAFPKRDGDWERLQGQSGRRVHALKMRAKIRTAVREFFETQSFVEVDTPLMVPSPGLDLHLEAFRIQGGVHGQERYLITSPEYQMKRLLAGGLARIYQITPCFRGGELGARHEPEFTMIEWYRAFATAERVCRDTEALVASLAQLVHETTMILPPTNLDSTAENQTRDLVDLAPPWDRMTVREAFEKFTDVRMDDVVDDEETFFRTLVEKIEPNLGRKKPTFLTRWPASMASLAQLCDDDPTVADRFEAYVGGVELCNGFGELIDPVEQRARLVRDVRARADAGLPTYPVDERFLGALEEGLPPCAGNALGFDRLVALILGERAIADVMSFPHARL